MRNGESAADQVNYASCRDVYRAGAVIRVSVDHGLAQRTGAGIDLKTALPRRGKTTEARAELTALEIELTRKLLQRTASAPGRAPEHAPGEAPQVRTRAKDKIIRALRRLK